MMWASRMQNSRYSRCVITFGITCIAIATFVLLAYIHLRNTRATQVATIDWLTSNGCVVSYHNRNSWDFPCLMNMLIFGDEKGNPVHSVVYHGGGRDDFSAEQFFRCIESLSHVEEVTFSPLPRTPGVFLELPADLKLQRLKRLNLRLSRISPASFSKSQKFPNLEVLSLESTNAIDIMLASMPKLQRIHSLDVGNNHLEGSFLASFPGTCHLKFLWLYNTDFSDVNSRYLERLTEVECLDLSGTPVTDASLFYIRTCKSLQLLKIDSCEIIGTGFAHLKELSNLRELWIGSLSGSLSTQFLPALPKLKKLVIYVHTLEAITLKGILHFTELEELDIVCIELGKIEDVLFSDTTPLGIKSSKSFRFSGERIGQLFAALKNTP